MRREHLTAVSVPSPTLSAPPSASVYDLNLALVDQDGRAFGLDGYRGHPIVISMFYASCPYACPTLISELQHFEGELPVAVRESLRVLLVSIDPKRDTPEKLKQLSRERHIDEARWRLTRASEDEVRQLAAVLGVKYKPLDGGGFNHTSVLAVLDQRGRLRARREGLGKPIDRQLLDTVSLLARE